MSHLHDVHKINRKDGGFQKYLDNNFDVVACSCGCGQQVRLHKREFAFSRFAPDCDGLNRSRSPGCIDFYLHRGMGVDEAVETFRLRQAVIAKGHSTEDLRDKLSKLNLGENNPASVSSIMKRTGKSRREVHAELSNKSSGSNNGFYGKSHADDVLVANANRIANSGNKNVIKPEMIMWAFLHALGIDFLFEESVDRYIADFKVGDIIIEVYGDYWHKPDIKMRWSDRGTRDNQRTQKLIGLGYLVEVFWESELLKTPRESFERLKLIFGKAQ